MVLEPAYIVDSSSKDEKKKFFYLIVRVSTEPKGVATAHYKAGSLMSACSIRKDDPGAYRKGRTETDDHGLFRGSYLS